MPAEMIEAYPDTVNYKAVKRAVEILRNDGVIVYPTDTIYGLGADLFSKKAMNRIMRIKHESIKKPLSFILPDLKDIATYANVPDYAYRIMRRVVPGPYTFVLPATRDVPKMLLYNRKQVGIRIPDAPLALAIIEELGNPILSTSVPIEDDLTYHTDPQEIFKLYGHDLDLIIDAGISFINPSTIVDFTVNPPEILRKGAGDVKALNY